MTKIRIVGEDALCCALGERLVANALPDWQLTGDSINTGGITKLKAALPRYVEQARHVQAMLCIADTDHQCAVMLRNSLLPADIPPSFVLRLAISEAESWVLADHQAIAEFFGIALKHIPTQPEIEPDAKRTLLKLAHLSKVRALREEMVSNRDINKPGSGYNLHLCRFVADAWRPDRAVQNSDSLRRALQRVAALNA